MSEEIIREIGLDRVDRSWRAFVEDKRQQDYGNRGTISTLLQAIDCFDTQWEK